MGTAVIVAVAYLCFVMGAIAVGRFLRAAVKAVARVFGIWL